jgi:hypothetical protein
MFVTKEVFPQQTTGSTADARKLSHSSKRGTPVDNAMSNQNMRARSS